jgi:hypothetical protein
VAGRALDAAALAGLLADDDRRAVFAALTLGAGNADEVGRRTGLSAPRSTKALGRLVDSGLVVTGDDGTMVVLGAAFQLAARQALTRPPRDEHAGEPAARRKVLDVFVHDGHIVSFPTARAKRRILLEWAVQAFEPGVRYTERQVNAILERRHPDTATLRRYLVDEELLDRSGGVYWRIGGALE